MQRKIIYPQPFPKTFSGEDLLAGQSEEYDNAVTTLTPKFSIVVARSLNAWMKNNPPPNGKTYHFQPGQILTRHILADVPLEPMRRRELMSWVRSLTEYSRSILPPPPHVVIGGERITRLKDLKYCKFSLMVTPSFTTMTCPSGKCRADVTAVASIIWLKDKNTGKHKTVVVPRDVNTPTHAFICDKCGMHYEAYRNDDEIIVKENYWW